jgi:glycosyltransferase involved in cell wall biosynthesis
VLAPGRRSPTVSVIVPVKDTPPWLLTRAVLSAVHQHGHHDLEVVVWDDGSVNEDCRAAIAGLARFPRVVIGRTTENRGISAARNAACDLATGEWLIWLDSDDELPLTAVKTLRAAAERNTLYVIGQCAVHLPAGSVVRHRNDAIVAQWRRARYRLDDPLLSTVFAVHGGMVHRELFVDVDGFDEGLRYAELTDWFLRTMAAVWPHEIAVVEATTYHYHKRPDSHSADREALEAHRRMALGRYARAMGWPDWERQFDARCAATGARLYDLVDADGTVRMKAAHEYERYCQTVKFPAVSSAPAG